MSGDHSADPLMGCGAGEWRSRSARVSAKQRLHRGEFAVAAVAQDSLVDWMQKQNADWRAFAAPGRLLAQPQEETMLQKLIDNAVDEVFAEYDECKSIRSRAVALMDDGEPRTIELTFSGGLTELATMLVPRVIQTEGTTFSA